MTAALVKRYGKGTDSDATDAMVIANTLLGKRGKGGGGLSPEETLVADTVRSHPRPGSNSNGALVTAFHATQDPICGDVVPAMGHEPNGDPVGLGVRRLTPKEAERLQGLPDGWTDIEWRGKPTPDSRRYAALGDAVTATVPEWVGRRIMIAQDACPPEAGAGVTPVERGGPCQPSSLPAKVAS